MEDFLLQYGYLALILGTFLEGETALLVASSLAYAGVFSVPETVFFGFLGSFLSDWTYFLIGRLNGNLFVERRPALKLKLEPAQRFFEKNRLQILISYRFLYGLRTILPLMIGLTGIRPYLFLAFSIVTGFLWSSLVGGAGYLAGSYFGLTAEAFEDYGILVILGFGIIGTLVGLTIKRFAEHRLKMDRQEQ